MPMRSPEPASSTETSASKAGSEALSVSPSWFFFAVGAIVVSVPGMTVSPVASDLISTVIPVFTLPRS